MFVRLLFGLRTIVAGLSPNAHAKEIDPTRQDVNQLRNADSFSVECKSDRTGTIDRETVDVDAGTVTVELPGREPVVHHITKWSLGSDLAHDRFGKPLLAVHLLLADWGPNAGITWGQ